MVTVLSLWLPILLSAVLVFLASSVIHMVLGYHRADYGKLPKEDAVMDALRGFDIPPGDYLLPCPDGPNSLKDPAYVARREKGPVALITVLKPGAASMGPSLLQWFLYCVVVSTFAGYVASRAVDPASRYLEVFRYVGTTAFCGYALALWQDSIWYKRQLGTTIRYTFDGLVYALLTAGTFGWLWPK